MAHEDLDALLSRMDAIAKAVNAFSSEAVQKEAFAAMVAAFEGKRHSAQHASAANERPENQRPEPPGIGVAEIESQTKSAEKVTKTKRSSKESRTEWKMVKDLDLRPAGKPSFEEFAEEKKPSSNEDKYVLVVYYLTETLGLSPVTIHQVGTVFRLMKTWKEPTDLAAGLRVTASRKVTLDTSDYEDIKLTPAGRNLVDHDLPPKHKIKK